MGKTQDYENSASLTTGTHSGPPALRPRFNFHTYTGAKQHPTTRHAHGTNTNTCRGLGLGSHGWPLSAAWCHGLFCVCRQIHPRLAPTTHFRTKTNKSFIVHELQRSFVLFVSHTSSAVDAVKGQVLLLRPLPLFGPLNSKLIWAIQYRSLDTETQNSITWDLLHSRISSLFLQQS